MKPRIVVAAEVQLVNVLVGMSCLKKIISKRRKPMKIGKRIRLRRDYCDTRDKNRKESSLKAAYNAHLIETNVMGIDEVCETAARILDAVLGFGEK